MTKAEGDILQDLFKWADSNLLNRKVDSIALETEIKRKDKETEEWEYKYIIRMYAWTRDKKKDFTGENAKFITIDYPSRFESFNSHKEAFEVMKIQVKAINDCIKLLEK